MDCFIIVVDYIYEFGTIFIPILRMRNGVFRSNT